MRVWKNKAKRLSLSFRRKPESRDPGYNPDWVFSAGGDPYRRPAWTPGFRRVTIRFTFIF